MIETEVLEPPASLPDPEKPEALVSPDSRNNNRHDPCLESPEKEVRPESATEGDEDRLVVDEESDVQDFEGRILYNADAAYILEGDAKVQEETELAPEPKLPLRRAFRVRSATPPKTLVQRFRVVTLAEEAEETKECDWSETPILICFLCKLSFSQAQSFESHLHTDHQLQLSASERRCLKSPHCSAIVQHGPQLSFLCPMKEKEKEISTEEMARNLMLASELSASRLLQQVSKNAMVMGLNSTGCSLHPEPKPECPNCDLVALKQQPVSAVQMVPHTSVSTSRNSCKTLKCPKCNWHYKYQETLEIHMKEKHPDTEVTCVYCLHSRAHPKLARGETYSCGYKPYRCEICNYSTTTKGNLSIHMQSDKHLNNVQELQKGNKLIDPSTFIHAESPTQRVISPTDSKSPAANPNSAFRCDMCNYETTVARNLRIHMTSEKHAQNMLLLQRKVAGGLREPQQDLSPFGQFTPMSMESLAMPLDESMPLRLYQCCVCFQFNCDSVDQLVGHVELDRSQPGPTDISVLGGNFFCNLCQYKTHLKANFQLHTKTDKHVQRLQLVNHIREGGLQNEWRLRYVNVNNPVHLRCNACNEFFTSWHRLQLHALSPQHQSSEVAFDKLRSVSPCAEQRLFCKLCDFEAERRSAMIAHLQSSTHAQLLSQALQSGGASEFLELCSNSDECSKTGGSDDGSDSLDPNVDMTDAVHCCALCNFACKSAMELYEHVQKDHDTTTNLMTPTTVSCPLCQSGCPGRDKLEQHLCEEHNVPDERVKHLLALLPTEDSVSDSPSQSSPTPASVAADSTTPTAADLEPAVSPSDDKGSLACPVCAVPFGSCSELYNHQSESGHLELKQTPRGLGYLCWHKGCNQYFQTTAAVQVHFREIHAKKVQPAGCVSDRHVYRYRCNQCSLAFRTEDKLKAHSVYHVMRASTRCALCSKSFRTIEALKRHVQSTHVGSESAKSPGTSPEESGNEEAERTPEEQTNGDEDNLNSAEMAELNYSDSSRKFKCHRCKMAFTKQQYLTSHNKSLGHKRGEKHNFSLDKYMDPNRPFKCDICKESFTQKTILLVHYNSVSHLHKTKKLLEQQASSGISTELLASLNKGQNITLNNVAVTKSSPVPVDQKAKASKPYRCNICHHTYGQPSTLETHLKSVAHQSKLAKLPELVISGEVDLNGPPLIEPIDFPHNTTPQSSKQTVSEMLNAKKATQSMVDLQPSTAALMASMMAPFLAQAFQATPNANTFICDQCNSIFATEEALQMHQRTVCIKVHQETPDEEEINENRPNSAVHNARRVNSRQGGTFKKLLQNYGFEVVMQYNETTLQRKRKAEQSGSNEIEQKQIKLEQQTQVADLPELGVCSCEHCGKQFSSIWVLKAHIEQVHQETVPFDAVEKLSEEFKEAYDKKQADDSGPLTPAAHPPPPAPEILKSPATSSAQTKTKKQTEPEAAKSAATSQPQMMFPNALAAMAMGMPGLPFMQPGFGLNPFMFPNPFMPMMMPSMTDPATAMSMASGFADLSKGFPVTTTAATSASAMPNLPAGMAQSPKRARTRITDDQLKVLREYFDINNSPTEQQIEEMSLKAGLPQKVIKHWFRNTLFKERQRNKDSPYNFSVAPTLGIDLDMYEKTGEAKVISLNADLMDIDSKPAAEAEVKQEPEEEMKEEEEIDVKNDPEEDEPKLTIDLKQEEPVRQEAAETEFSVSGTPSPTPTSQVLSAQETLRRLSVPPQIPLIPSSVTHPFSMLLAAQNQTGLANQSPSTNRSTSQSPGATASADAMTNLIANAMTGPGVNYGQGRRANRTRFTDFQLKTLQDFFEKQAYPKDDDLEFLSKKLQLSPRVIVVWFQNARQKARKIYENQPNADSSERFVKTPGCNFQCKRCNLVFQRYYELIQHQQKDCYKNEVIPSLKDTASPNSDYSNTNGAAEFRCQQCDIGFAEGTQLDEHLQVHANNPLLFDEIESNSKRSFSQMLDETTSSNGSPSPSRGGKKPKTDTTIVCVQGGRNRASKQAPRTQSFNKRCPFCGILFHSKAAMESHLPARHAEQLTKTTVNIDLLPDAEEVPTITTATLPTDDESMVNGNSLVQSMLSFGLLPTSSDNPMEVLKRLTEGAGGLAPLDLSQSVKVSTSSGGSSGPLTDSGGGSEGSMVSDNDDNQSLLSQDSPSPQLHISSNPNAVIIGGASLRGRFRPGSSKRFRTHLTPMQVAIMKAIFSLYKTPSMAECEQLGSEIGLHKRVIQVWFQNARAKERKARQSLGVEAPAMGPTSGQTQSCTLCNVAFNAKCTLHDHLFSTEHINTLRQQLKLQGTEDVATTSYANDNGALVENTAPQEQKQQTAESNPQAQNPDAALAAQQLLSNPYLMNPAAYMMYGAGFGGIPSLGTMPLYDPSIHGTPVQLLQIPPEVKQTITAKLESGATGNCIFTQDGMELSQLAATVSDRDFRCAKMMPDEVGWACRKCKTVFQSEGLFKNHQQLVCQTTEPVFKLIQNHYQCQACDVKFGTQVEYQSHIAKSEHVAKRELALS